MGRPRSWTDEDLRDAVAGAATLSDVLRRLGLSIGGATMDVVRRRMLELGLDEPRLLRNATSARWADGHAAPPVAGRWTDDELRMAVVCSTSMRQVLERLGRPGSGVAWTAAKARILELDLDTSHFTRRNPTARPPVAAPPPPRRRSWADADLIAAVERSRSVAGVIRLLGLKIGGSVYPLIQGEIRRLGLSTEHFTGRGWSRGLKPGSNRGRPLEEILVAGSTHTNTASLKKRLFDAGLKERRCDLCGIERWQGRPAPLQLDHVNGTRTDNRLENLRILCPNCHAQTDTWCSKNRGRDPGSGSLVEMADTHRSKWCAFGREGSNPSGPTSVAVQLRLSGLADLD